MPPLLLSPAGGRPVPTGNVWQLHGHRRHPAGLPPPAGHQPRAGLHRWAVGWAAAFLWRVVGIGWRCGHASVGLMFVLDDVSTPHPLLCRLPVCLQACPIWPLGSRAQGYVDPLSSVRASLRAARACTAASTAQVGGLEAQGAQGGVSRDAASDMNMGELVWTPVRPRELATFCTLVILGDKGPICRVAQILSCGRPPRLWAEHALFATVRALGGWQLAV